MSITPITANPPAQGSDPWFTERDLFDQQVKATANAAAAGADAALAANVIDGVLDHDEVPPAPGIYLRRPAP